GQRLSGGKQHQAESKLETEIGRRAHESPADHAARVGEFQKERNRDRRCIEEFSHAFNFKLLGEEQLGQHAVYVIEATPRPGYKPPDRETAALTGMRGKLWVDKQTYQWAKVEAEVFHSVSIIGFLAKIDPGT